MGRAQSSRSKHCHRLYPVLKTGIESLDSQRYSGFIWGERMPTKLKIVLVLLLLGLGSSYLQESWFGVGFYVFCMAGLLRGTEAVRNLLIFGGYAGVLLAIISLVSLGLTFSSNAAIAQASQQPGFVAGVFIYYGFSLATNCFFVYVLRDVEVQDWLLMRSLGESD